MYILLYIPAYNEAAKIREVIDSLPRQLPGADEVGILVVDDGSVDETSRIAEAAGAAVIRHEVNKGVGGAFHTALHAALNLGVDILVSVDADGQFNAAEIPRLIQPILEGRADFVTGNRFSGGRPSSMPAVRYWGNILMSRVVSTLSPYKRIQDVSCGFRAYSREALLHLNLYGRFTYTQETLMDMAFKELRIVEHPIGVRYFEGRRSRVARNLPMYGFNTMKIILRTFRDYRPMLFFGTMGLSIVGVGLVMGLFVMYHYIQTGQISPYKMFGIGSGLLMLAGLLVLAYALLADMMDRIRTTQEKLLYYEKKRVYSTKH